MGDEEMPVARRRDVEPDEVLVAAQHLADRLRGRQVAVGFLGGWFARIAGVLGGRP